MYRLGAVAAAGRPVRHHRNRCVTQSDLACQRRFRHTRHTHHVDAVALEPVDLGCRFQTRALRSRIDAAVDRRQPCCACCLHQIGAQHVAIRVGEIDVRDRLFRSIEKGVFATVGVIDDLTRNDDGSGLHVGADAADRGHRYHPRDILRMQRPDIGAVIHRVRRNGMAIAVACDEHHLATVQLAESQCAGRLPVGRARHFATRDFETCQLREASAPEYAEHDQFFIAYTAGRLRHASFTSMPKPNT